MSSNVLSAPEIAAGVFSDTTSHDVAVSVRGLAKSYSIAKNAEQHSTMGDALMAKLRNPFAKAERETFWALNDVNFDIQKGDVVGIIGRNGAGKSTLLKILSRITEPTKGKIDLFGRVGSLLEVGTGFHPELTGRENVYLNGAILGMQKSEIARQFDAIVDFSGTEQFLDTPVKRYSSGMYVRLAFAVAAHLNPEILIIDEVLAVGDAEFQKKCIGKMQDVASSGRTVLFVSHNMATVRQLCSTGIMLDSGYVSYRGPADKAVAVYMEGRSENQFVGKVSSQGVELLDVSLVDLKTGIATQSPLFNQDYELRVTVQAHQPLRENNLVVRVHDDMGAVISHMCSLEEGISSFPLSGVHRFAFHLPRLQLYPGRYSADVLLTHAIDPAMPLSAEDAFSFEVQEQIIHDAAWAYKRNHGVARICSGLQMTD